MTDARPEVEPPEEPFGRPLDSGPEPERVGPFVVLQPMLDHLDRVVAGDGLAIFTNRRTSGWVALQPSVLCASGFGTLDEPSAQVPLTSDAIVTINTGDLNDLAHADVSAGEFARLAAGEEPSAGAPDFTFFDFPTFVRVQDGEVVQANQIYTS